MASLPNTLEKLDIGFEIMEQLLIKEEPLTEDQIIRYMKIWKKGCNPSTNYHAARQYLCRIVTLLSRCQLPVPMGVAEQVCMCSSFSLKQYNWDVLHPIRIRVMGRQIWEEIPLEKVPKFDNLMIRAMGLKLSKE